MVHARHSQGKILVAGQLALILVGFFGVGSTCFGFCQDPVASWYTSGRKLRVAYRAEGETAPELLAEEVEEKPKRNRVIGQDGKTGKQRRAASARQRKKELINAEKDGPMALSLIFGDVVGSLEARVFYKGAPKKLTHEAILEKFQEAGEVASLEFWQQGDKSPMGMGVVGYRNEQAAQSAVDTLDGAELQGRKLKVSRWITKVGR